eukprot:TRINITY_DN7147_c0_g1_i1.p1 TRINITY_DN7147_c0_g1~~TRINITY_DN7147_c0_g1_i1.p1  ORF type:complete len:419 (-),score=82.10 TRINITY_DN7147_c0_g1_i1:947-2134(-)
MSNGNAFAVTGATSPAEASHSTAVLHAKLHKKKKAQKAKSKPKPIVKPLTREFKNREEAHSLILKFHERQKRLEQLESLPANKDVLEQIEKIKEEMEELGGIELYQKASMHGETFKAYNTSKWVLKCLKEHGFRTAKDATGNETQPKMKTLDVGAINNHFKGIKWMDLTPIDINPMDSGVIQCDFFDFDGKLKSFDVIVLSLVINFVGDPRKRGVMLRRCADLLKCKSPTSRGGLLFLVIPSACIENSRYLTHELLSKMLEAVGFAILQHKTSKKLAFYMLELVERKRISPDQAAAFKKQVIRQGGDKNNFFIHLDPAYTLEILRKEKKEAAKSREKSTKRKRESDEDADGGDDIVEPPKKQVAPAAKPASKSQSKKPAARQPTQPPKKKQKIRE